MTDVKNNDDSLLYLPTWISDTEIDPQWIEQVTTSMRGVIRCHVEDISNQGRRREEIRNGSTLRLHLTYDQEKQDDENDDDHDALLSSQRPRTLVIKQVPPDGRPQSQMLGLAREAYFYQHLAPHIGLDAIPKIYYSVGDMESGAKLVLMEDLSNSSYLDSGILFGPGNPNNWDRDLPACIAKAYPHHQDGLAGGDGGSPTTKSSSSFSPPSSAQVARETFVAIAQVHATFWKNSSLLLSSSSISPSSSSAHPVAYLRGANWIQGLDRSTWEQSQGYIQGIWKGLIDSGTIDTVIEWDPLVRACLTKAMEGISWESQLERLNTQSHWTLVHGDFWPGNVLVATTTSTNNIASSSSTTSPGFSRLQLKLLDWEMVGVGSGPQDLGQYVLSNMDPQERRDCEYSLVQDYYSTLVKWGVPQGDFSWEECWREYKIGGIERWLWFLVYFVGQQGMLLKWAQFFHDQIRAFVIDHDISPEDLVQPRP